MRLQREYQQVGGEEVEAQKRKVGFEWNDTEIIPTSTKSFVFYLCIFLISFSANVLLVLDNARLRIARDTGRTIYSDNTFDTVSTFHSFSEYWHPNLSQATVDATWDAIDTDTIAVALQDGYAKKVGLSSSTRFPWDTERSVYYIKGIHDLHCLKLIRKAISAKHNNLTQTFDLRHIYHCLDNLRQDVICMADDTPMPVSTAHHVGDGQRRRCRDWDKMLAWTKRPDQHACFRFDDYREATNTLELFAFCPDDSPYRSIMEKYFEFHGHKDTYAAIDEEEITLF